MSYRILNIILLGLSPVWIVPFFIGKALTDSSFRHDMDNINMFTDIWKELK